MGCIHAGRYYFWISFTRSEERRRRAGILQARRCCRRVLLRRRGGHELEPCVRIRLLRLFAYKSPLLPGPAWLAFADSLWRIPMVAAKVRRPLESSDHAGPGFADCVLGAHRNRLRTHLSVFRPVVQDFDGCDATALARSSDAFPGLA